MATVKQLPLDDLRPNPNNPKRHANDTIRQSISRFGFVEPVVQDQRTGYTISGHGRIETLTAMRDAGDHPPEGVTVTKGVWKVPTIVSWSSTSDAEAEAALVALNRTGEIGGWDTEQLTTILTSLKEDDALDGIGYSDEDIDVLRRVLEAEDQFTMDFTDVIDEFIGETGTGKESYVGGSAFRKITVVFPDEESVVKFFDALAMEYDADAASICYPFTPPRRPIADFDG